MLKYLMAYNNHEYGSKSIYRQHMECLNTSWLTTIEYAPRVPSQHMECLNTSWLTTNEYTAAIVNTWNAYLNTNHEWLSSTHGMQSWVRQQEYLSSTHGMLKYLMAYNNHEYGSKSTYRQHMECLNTSWLTTIMSTAARVSIVNTWNA